MKRDSPVDSLRFSGRDFSQQELAVIRAWLAENTLCREHLARRVCQEFGWFNAAGRPQTMSCKVALLRMHRAGLIELPAPAHPDTNHRKRKPALGTDVGTAPGMPALFPSQLAMDAEQVRQVRLEVVQTAADRAIYHQLLQAHHYLGAGSMAGAQLRYLARSGGEVVGAFGFGASAWLVAGRDRFIGWSDTSRRANLHLVVNNNRFLIPPWVRAPNLASRLLSLVARRIAADWNSRYGYSPVLLETFVELERFKGTCYRAANWIGVGTTKGRGKLEKNHRQILPLKSVLVYPLQKNFRAILAP
ncbi:MAG: Druantia anti-phage system protein DruA [Verrucomicrobiae bacterium]